jgi:rSAM/selenodomain-associated transferase 1
MDEREFRILIFAKAPIAGDVKTRLIPFIGPERAREVFEQLLEETICTALAAHRPVELWCAPAANHPFFDNAARRYGIKLRQQVGSDLGARMLHACEESFEAGALPIVVGCDCPDLCVDDLAAAMAGLSAGADAVLGPAEDGGYYLLALARSAPNIFKDVPWGSKNALEATRRNLLTLRYKVAELATRWDVDRPEDYLRWVE